MIVFLTKHVILIKNIMKRKVRLKMGKEKNSIGFGLGLIAGVVGGIFAGLLYAPKPGEESRKELKETVSELAEKHSPEIKEAKKQAMESIDLMRYKLERQIRKAVHMFKSQKLQKAKEREDIEYDLN